MVKKQKISQNTRILRFLGKGKVLSTKQIRTMFSAKKPSARITELRRRGNNIQSTKNSKGNFAYKLVPAPELVTQTV